MHNYQSVSLRYVKNIRVFLSLLCILQCLCTSFRNVVLLQAATPDCQHLEQSDEDMDNKRQEERRYGRRYRICISASFVIILLLFVLLYFKLGLLGLGGGEPDLCVEKNRYGCVYGDYRRSAPDESLISTAKATGYSARFGAGD